MRHLRKLGLVAGVALVFSVTGGSTFAADTVSTATDPGFRPDNGQINRGFDPKLPTTSGYRKVPTQAEVLAAIMTPVSTQPSLGDDQHATLPAGETMRAETKDAQTTAGGPQATNAGTDTSRNGSQESSGAKPQSATMGAGASEATAARGGSGSGGATAQGPIGAIGATMPAKFSQRNDTLDRVPIMAYPLPLSAQERKQIYQAVMEDKSAAASEAGNLAPASILSSDQYFNDLRPLPASVAGIVGVKGLAYMKAKNKVLLVEPSTRVVFDEINS
jgi:hypothetical protein